MNTPTKKDLGHGISYIGAPFDEYPVPLSMDGCLPNFSKLGNFSLILLV